MLTILFGVRKWIPHYFVIMGLLYLIGLARYGKSQRTFRTASQKEIHHQRFKSSSKKESIKDGLPSPQKDGKLLRTVYGTLIC